MNLLFYCLMRVKHVLKYNQMLDTFLIIVSALLPLLMTVAGFFVALKIPGARHHNLLRVGIFLVAAMACVFTVWQQNRANNGHKEEVNGLNRTISGLNTQVGTLSNRLNDQGNALAVAQAETRGMLTGLGVKISEAANYSNPAVKDLGRSIAQLASNMTVTAPPQVAVVRLKNSELVTKAHAIAVQMRKLQQEMEEAETAVSLRYTYSPSMTKEERSAVFERESLESIHVYQEQSNRWFSGLKVDAAYIYNEIRARLPQLQFKRGNTDYVFEPGSAGALPLDAAADYLEQLARLLPPDAKAK